MKKILLTCSFIIVLFQVNAQLTKKVLFLGNSYTQVNNLPLLIQQLADSKGDSLIFDSNLPGGYTLKGHSTNTTSINKINSSNWDYVVIQEQSQIPSFPPSQVATDCFPYATTLHDLITANDSCTRIMFYMTWGRKNGDALNCGFYPPVCTYSGMQKRLKESYVQLANDNNASVAPVGIAWENSIKADSNLNLYQSDQSHPNIYGSYLAACVFYTSIFHKSSIGGFHPASISASNAQFLQGIADKTVFDSLNTWRIDTSDLTAAISSSTLDSLEYNFNAVSSRVNAKFEWDIDGQKKYGQSISYTFPGPGKYKVVLHAIDGCDISSSIETINIMASAVPAIKSGKDQIQVWPNPFVDELFISTEHIKEELKLEIFDMTGRLLVSSVYPANKQDKISVRIEEKGLFILKLNAVDFSKTVRIIRK